MGGRGVGSLWLSALARTTAEEGEAADEWRGGVTGTHGAGRAHGGEAGRLFIVSNR